MDYVRDPSAGEWVSFDMGAPAPARLLTDLLPKGYTDAYSVDIAEFPIGGFSPEHVDTGHAFYIISGRSEMIIDGTSQIAGTRCVVGIPAGKPHSIRNIGDEPLVMLTIYDPPRVRKPAKNEA
jgi:mannose-6-phosphate isomerase-like protein (cupin superfamily)